MRSTRLLARAVTACCLAGCALAAAAQVDDGEVQVTLAGMRALNGVLDFLLLTGLCDWPETTEEIDELLPPPGWLKRRIASFVKVAL